MFIINGQQVESNDVYATLPADISVSLADPSFAGEEAKLYIAQGYMTAAQMKYASPLDGSYHAGEKGYYTILAQGAERGMHLAYVYVF
jgi:hypothetical protein